MAQLIIMHSPKKPTLSMNSACLYCFTFTLLLHLCYPGALGIVGLAVAVGALAIVSVTGSVGGSGGSVKAPAEVKQLLDRVPEPLPVVRRAQQAATQVASKGETWNNK